MAGVENNPWSSKDLLLGMKLGDPHSGIVLSRSCGLRGKRVESGKGFEEHEKGDSSVRLIHTLREVSALNRALLDVEFQLHRALIDKESKDLLHVGVLEQRLKSVDELLSYFTSVLSSKESILNRLQSSSTENSLAVEAPYHKHLVGIVHAVSPSLSNLASNGARIESAVSLDVTPAMKGKMTSAVQSLVKCREIFQTCRQLHEKHER